MIVGLTGSFGSGKSTVAKIFRSYGAKVIDADKLAHQCLKVKSPACKKIIRIFGKGIFDSRGNVDRAKLGQIVFRNKILLKKLNWIVHPEVIKAIKNEIKRIKRGLVVLDAPLLLEAKAAKLVDKIAVVKISRKKQVERLKAKLGISEAEILRRIKCQLPLPLKIRLADFVIDNSSTLKETKKQVAEIRRHLWKS